MKVESYSMRLVSLGKGPRGLSVPQMSFICEKMQASSNNTAGRALPLYTTNLGSVPIIPYNFPQVLSRVTQEFKARNKA